MENFVKNLWNPIILPTHSQMKLLQTTESFSLSKDNLNLTKSQNQSQTFFMEIEEQCNIYDEDDDQTFSVESM